MSQIQVDPIAREEWPVLAAEFRDYNYRQCWDYGRMLAQKRKARSLHVKIRRGDEILGLADVRIKRAPFLGGIAYISGGPLVRKGKPQDLDRLTGCLHALREHFVKSQGLILRIQGTMGDFDWNRRAADCFASLGFKSPPAAREYRTIVVDLARPLSDIRAGFVQKWRNCLNKAERMNPPVRITRAAADFSRFHVLFELFTRRKGFAADLDAAFFRQLQEHLPPAEALTLAIVEVDGKLVAGHLSATLGDTCVYLLGATSDEALKTNAAYLLQWAAIRMAHEKGMRWYDLGGIDSIGNPGVYHFKCGLGGAEMCAPGPFELVPDAIGAHLLLRAEGTLRRLRRHERRSRAQQDSHDPSRGSGALPTPPSATVP